MGGDGLWGFQVAGVLSLYKNPEADVISPKKGTLKGQLLVTFHGDHRDSQ